MNRPYELDDLDRDLIRKARYAVAGLENGEPLKDSFDDDDMEDAVKLLVKLTKGRT